MGFRDGDFRDDGSKFQHVGPETANAREPYVTVRVKKTKAGIDRSPHEDRKAATDRYMRTEF